MPGKLTLDTRDFSRWAAAEIKFSRKDAAEVLNKAAGDVALRAVNLVPRANAARMDRLLKSGPNQGVMLASGRRSQSRSTHMQTFRSSGYVLAVLRYYMSTGRMPSFALGVMPRKLKGINHLQGLSADQMQMLGRQYVNAKKSSIGYIAVGFIMVARFFGKPITTRISSRGYVYHSTGVKATPGKLTAKLMNFARGADKAPGVRGALQSALNSVTGDIRNHLTQKIAARARRAGAIP